MGLKLELTIQRDELEISQAGKPAIIMIMIFLWSPRDPVDSGDILCERGNS